MKHTTIVYTPPSVWAVKVGDMYLYDAGETVLPLSAQQRDGDLYFTLADARHEAARVRVMLGYPFEGFVKVVRIKQ